MKRFVFNLTVCSICCLLACGLQTVQGQNTVAEKSAVTKTNRNFSKKSVNPANNLSRGGHLNYPQGLNRNKSFNMGYQLGPSLALNDALREERCALGANFDFYMHFVLQRTDLLALGTEIKAFYFLTNNSNFNKYTCPVHEEGLEEPVVSTGNWIAGTVQMSLLTNFNATARCNIQLKANAGPLVVMVPKNDVKYQISEIQLDNSKGSRLPQVSGSTSENFSFGRGLTADNTYSNTNTTSTGISLGTAVPVFQGFRIRNSIKEGELNLQATTAELEKAREDMSVSVAQAYVQILYNMELLDVALNQVGIDSLQVERLSAMLENGKASPAQLAQQKAALGQSRLSATQARNNLNLSLLDLSQLLELPNPEGFSIVRPSVPIDGILLGNPEDIYAEAVENKPAIKAAMFRLDASDFTIKGAKGAFLPSISANGGLGTNYYTMSSAPSATFMEQVKHNFSQYLGVSLSVPIFSGFQNRNQVRLAELSRTNQMLQLENTKKTLYKEIQQAYYNAVAAADRYRSSEDAKESARESFELMKAKYENGKSNITEFNEARDSWLEAESNLVRSRYEYLYSAKLLDFYRGRPLEF